MENIEEVFLECDLVMKGGITSGIVYPDAICELAKTYRFRCIGGTSAGAIAAAAAAAAELGRNKPDAGFTLLQKLPKHLSTLENGQSNLEALFEPQPETANLYRALMKLHARPNAPAVSRFLSFGAEMARHSFGGWVAGIATGGITFLPAVLAGGALPGMILGGALGLLSGGVATGIASTVQVTRKGLAAIEANGFGICNGKGSERALTIWLTKYLDELAGKPTGDSDPPLTFGDLEKHKIELVMNTTSLTQGQPYRLPFSEDRGDLYFSKKEMLTLFPERVVNQMLQGRTLADFEVDGHQIYKMPPSDELPVIVATRMSLSFPFLLSAVPLWAMDFSFTVENEKNRKPGRLWFSDGGLTSNFPIHLFDSLLPSRPTFAINLAPFHPAHPKSEDERKNVSLPKTNSSGQHVRWQEINSLGGFGGAIISTMQNWVDAAQSRAPGYRDRIARVYLSPDEGGLNLNMPEKNITALAKRGQHAAELLVQQFGVADPITGYSPGWDNHRWIRLRTSMAVLEQLLLQVDQNFNQPTALSRSYATLLSLNPDEHPSYKFKGTQQQQAVPRISSMLGTLHGQSPIVQDGAPKPSVEVKFLPKT